MRGAGKPPWCCGSEAQGGIGFIVDLRIRNTLRTSRSTSEPFDLSPRKNRILNLGVKDKSTYKIHKYDKDVESSLNKQNFHYKDQTNGAVQLSAHGNAQYLRYFFDRYKAVSVYTK